MRGTPRAALAVSTALFLGACSSPEVELREDTPIEMPAASDAVLSRDVCGALVDLGSSLPAGADVVTEVAADLSTAVEDQFAATGFNNEPAFVALAEAGGIAEGVSDGSYDEGSVLSALAGLINSGCGGSMELVPRPESVDEGVATEAVDSQGVDETDRTEIEVSEGETETLKQWEGILTPLIPHANFDNPGDGRRLTLRDDVDPGIRPSDVGFEDLTSYPEPSSGDSRFPRRQEGDVAITGKEFLTFDDLVEQLEEGKVIPVEIHIPGSFEGGREGVGVSYGYVVDMTVRALRFEPGPEGAVVTVILHVADPANPEGDATVPLAAGGAFSNPNVAIVDPFSSLSGLVEYGGEDIAAEKPKVIPYES